MAEMEPVLRGSVLVSGFFGAVWWMHRPQSRPGLFRTDQSGSSLGEWRMRVGFIDVPLPCFGGEHYRDLVRISRAPEMRPWVLGRGYDKPIPRRILEEAGVSRGTFGEVKRASLTRIRSGRFESWSWLPTRGRARCAPAADRARAAEPPPIRTTEPLGTLDRRRLAGAVEAEDAEDLARGYRQVDAVDRDALRRTAS